MLVKLVQRHWQMHCNTITRWRRWILTVSEIIIILKELSVWMGWYLFCNLLHNFFNSCQMQYFGWLGSDVGDSGAKALADALQHNNTLTTLDLEREWNCLILFKSCQMQYFGWLDNDVGDAGAKALADALQRNSTLTTLNLSSEWWCLLFWKNRL